ncbi:MAG: tetratricopeptide repeat protein [Verrucomicrobiales bacterium]
MKFTRRRSLVPNSIHKARLGVAFCAIFIPNLYSADFIGAEELLRRIEAAKEAKKAPAKADDPASKFKADLQSWKKNRATLSEQDAAKRWLELYDQFISLPPEAFPHVLRNRVDPDEEAQGTILTLLPPPKGWPALKEKIESKTAGKNDNQASGLRLLGYALTGDVESQKKELQAVQKSLAEKARNEDDYQAIHLYGRAQAALLRFSEDPEVIYGILMQMTRPDSNLSFYSYSELGNFHVKLPEEKSKEIIKRLLLAEEPFDSFEENKEAQKLAQKTALEMVDKLKKPAWNLVSDLSDESIALYEKLSAKFSNTNPAEGETANVDKGDLELPPGGGSRDYNRNNADIYYLLALVLNDQPEKAQKHLLSLGSRFELSEYVINEALRSRDSQLKLWEVLKGALETNPEMPLWEIYIKLGAQIGKTDEVTAVIKKASTRPNLPTKIQRSMQSALIGAYLAGGKVEEAVSAMEKLPKAAPSAYDYSEDFAAITLARLGYLLGNGDWEKKGLSQLSTNSSQYLPVIIDLHLKQNRLAEAESLIAKALLKNPEGSPGNNNDGIPGNSLLPMLIHVYHQADRPEDIVTLLDKSVQWKTRDVIDLTAREGKRFGPSFEDGFLPTQFIAASALAKTGKKDDAIKILKYLLTQNPGFDKGYELLLQLSPETAISYFDELMKLDQFQERPLIWKAQHLFNQKKYDEAEKIVRQAIAIDPSDGEQGRGDRLRAYALLGEISRAQGKEKEAEFLAGAIKAIRQSEQADLFYATGLLGKAIKMYEESLTYFADAYCIQSRLAIQLSQMGMQEQAEAHYAKAYELMPDSFGRVESHCFGCEGAFEGENAQGIAERVFSKMLEKNPEKPQLHYLMGYLRKTQGNTDEAAKHYRKAVELDPQYLNAWVKLSEISDEVDMSQDQRDEIVLKILQFDPLSRHSHINASEVVNLQKLALVLEEVSKLSPPKPKSLYPLQASAAEIDSKSKGVYDNMPGYSRFYDRSATGSSFQTILASHPVGSLALTLMMPQHPGKGF